MKSMVTRVLFTAAATLAAMHFLVAPQMARAAATASCPDAMCFGISQPTCTHAPGYGCCLGDDPNDPDDCLTYNCHEVIVPPCP